MAGNHNYFADGVNVSNSHKYKSLPVYTSMTELAGIPQTRSDRATNMLMRTRWLQEQHGGRGVVFATGTPISNTMAEMYNIQRYVQPEELKARGLERFDAWANTFGEFATELEPDLKGGYKTKTRFSKFVNVPELMQISRQDLDVRRVDSLPPNPDGTPAVKRPKRIEHMVLAPETSGIHDMMADIHTRAQAIQGRRQEKGQDNPLSLTTEGRQGSVDLRLFDAGAEDHPDSKANMMVRNVLQWYHDPQKAGQTQLIFSDIGVHPAPSGFHLYQDIIDKLVKGGIPRDEIADFGSLDGNAKVEAAQKLKAGKMRIGIGSTERLGTGNNVQNYLGAMHHLDIPYVPTAIEQRDGRGHRHGNKNSEVHIFRYVSEGSLDEMSWGIVSRKANFIRQAVTDPKAGQRSVTEEDAEVLTPQQLMAAASGDTRILEKVNLKDQVKTLQSGRARHEREQRKLSERVKSGRESLERFAEQSKRIAQDAAHLDETPDFHVELSDGRQSTDRAQAAELLTSVSAEADAAERKLGRWEESEPVKVGEYRGMPLYRHKSAYTLVGPSGQAYSTGDSLGSIENVARNLTRRADKLRDEMDQVRKDLASIGQQIGKPFSRAAELAKAEEKLAALEKDLKEKPKGAPELPEVEKNARRRLVDLFQREYRRRGDKIPYTATNRVVDVAAAFRREFAARGF